MDVRMYESMNERYSRRTVVLQPDCARAVALVQKMLLDNGWTASFSASLNLVIRVYVLAMIRQQTPRSEIAASIRRSLESKQPVLSENEFLELERFLSKAKQTVVNRDREL